MYLNPNLIQRTNHKIKPCHIKNRSMKKLKSHQRLVKNRFWLYNFKRASQITLNDHKCTFLKRFTAIIKLPTIIRSTEQRH